MSNPVEKSKIFLPKKVFFILSTLGLVVYGCAPQPNPQGVYGNPPAGGEVNNAYQKGAEFFNKLGLAAMAEANYAKAIANFVRATELNPYDPVYWKNLGEAYMAAKFYSKAQKAFLQALKLKPDYGEAMLDLGLLYKAQGDYNRAIYWLSKAANLDTFENRYIAYYELAKVYKELGNDEAYVENLQRAVDLLPSFKEGLLALANYYLKKGDLANAEKYLKLYLSFYPNDYNIRLKLASLLIEENKLTEAKKLLKTIIEKSPNPQIVDQAYKLVNKLLIKEAQNKLKKEEQ
ncbi:MAG: tetratricopeptide repeat protein [Aquificae bacterium]|jgi:type IV pilus assembly protein PilF|nr:tetratricopeptide repeat protein [Aquificota bacterium]